MAVEVVQRTGRYAIRLRDPHAPARADFAGVPTFPFDPAWVLDGRVRQYAEPREIVVGAARPGLLHHVQVIGEVDLAHAGHAVTLLLTGTGDRASILFSDETPGVAPWRILAVDLPGTLAPGGSGTVRVDFNEARNLPFAFTEHGTCPAPAPGNHVPFAVPAGEKAPR
ncbi:DUF1684 domain-containing protein [Xylanimonas allomyrinae]|uniref:DUF1684 domain-containing protein n=1 Tax=Xylanimonas allomyrinae TaxID=2509459 RepID=UPI0013A64D8C|nr:DUF1684 domain-containing protein [Xylanimonas allomyrinae]